MSTQMVRATLAVWGLGYGHLVLITKNTYWVPPFKAEKRHFEAAVVHFTVILLSFPTSIFL